MAELSQIHELAVRRTDFPFNPFTGRRLGTCCLGKRGTLRNSSGKVNHQFELLFEALNLRFVNRQINDAQGFRFYS